MAENTVIRVGTGQLGRRPTNTIFKILHERTERLQKLYAEGRLSTCLKFSSTHVIIVVQNPFCLNLLTFVLIYSLLACVKNDKYEVCGFFIGPRSLDRSDLWVKLSVSESLTDVCETLLM